VKRIKKIGANQEESSAMNSKTGNNFTGAGKDSLIQYLKPDTPEIKKIKSLQGKELEYSDYLGTIEYILARYFYENGRTIKDKDAVAALENIRENSDKNISFFEYDLEKEILENLIELLEEESITLHEFELIIDYVLEVIDNRAWMEDEQAYLKWATYIMGLFTEEEAKEYEESVQKLAIKMGLSSKHADLMLLKGEEEDYFDFVEEYGKDDGEESTEEELMAEIEERFLSMTDEEKSYFLLENGPDFYELLGLYTSLLSERGEFEKLQELYRNFTERYDDFIYLDIFMGAAYVEKDRVLAKSYFEKALKNLDALDEFSDSTKEELKLNLLDLINKIK
jgi:hypothetical protein